MAARIRKLETTAEWREKIRVSMLLNRLARHAVGKTPMTATQVRAAEILLKKVLPDLSAQESTVTHRVGLPEISDYDLAAIAIRGGNGIAAPTNGAKEPDKVH